VKLTDDEIPLLDDNGAVQPTLLDCEFAAAEEWKSRCRFFPSIISCILATASVATDTDSTCQKISPVGDWGSTSLEWPWFRPYSIPSCITDWPLPTYQISL